MSIWYSPVTLEDLYNRFEGIHTINDALGIQLTEIGEDYLKGTMPVDKRTFQPMGIMHGGASCVLAETLGSSASYLCVNQKTHYTVGLDVHTSHIRSVRSGLVTGTAKPIHIGRSTHLWEIPIANEDGKLVSITRLMMFVKER